ncbi:hypothetical protein M407DRAFT_33005 [Tulasnella calospora MUT 4182]|uniref:Uncharacterized protein n=1 Tax=Tulasnella calospora MUT 4182 TaxID=1051891 RepID=A0A0C3PRS3_9AGAM|nr:hypothetical protein M407DRAFT_33005 [Tulasnella calospora MUT 4182]
MKVAPSIISGMRIDQLYLIRYTSASYSNNNWRTEEPRHQNNPWSGQDSAFVFSSREIPCDPVFHEPRAPILRNSEFAEFTHPARPSSPKSKSRHQ